MYLCFFVISNIILDLPKYLFNTLLKHSFENLILLFCILINTISFAQTTKGTVTADGMPLQMANIVLKNTKINHQYRKRFLSF
jgi:hypothetical protein